MGLLTQARTLHITHRQAGTEARRWAHTPSPGVGGWSLLALRPRSLGALRGGGVAISSRIHTQCCAVQGCYARRPSALAPRSGSRGHASGRPASTRDTHPAKRVSLNFLQSVVLAFLPHSGVFPRGWVSCVPEGSERWVDLEPCERCAVFPGCRLSWWCPGPGWPSARGRQGQKGPKEEKRKEKPTAPGIPRRSPIQVLTRPDPA